MVRFAFIFGVAVSMLLYEKRHLTTGSIVVPGYIATFFIYPFIIVATFANALMTYWLVNRLLRRWFLLYGRTKITVLAMISIGIQTAMLKLTPSGPWLWESDFKLIVGVGYVVPALIAHDMGRQGIAKTTKSVLLASSIVGVPIVLALAFNVPGVNDLAPLTGFGDMALDAAWLPVAVLLSASAAWGVANNYGLRSGGFVGAAFVGMLLGDPWQLVIAVTIAAITYVLVTRVFMKNMILFGRRKFSAMLLTASSISWALMWTGAEFFGPGVQEHLDIGSLALTPLFIPGLLANDAQRTSPTRVLIGVSLAASFVLATTWWVQSMFEEVSLHVGWKIVSVLTFTAIFGRQLVPANIMATADTTVADEHEYQLAPVPASTGAAILRLPTLCRVVRGDRLRVVGRRPSGSRSVGQAMAQCDGDRHVHAGGRQFSRQRTERRPTEQQETVPASPDWKRRYESTRQPRSIKASRGARRPATTGRSQRESTTARYAAD